MYPVDDRELQIRLLARDVRDLAMRALALAQERRRLLLERRPVLRLDPVANPGSTDHQP